MIKQIVFLLVATIAHIVIGKKGVELAVMLDVSVLVGATDQNVIILLLISLKLLRQIPHLLFLRMQSMRIYHFLFHLEAHV